MCVERPKHLHFQIEARSFRVAAWQRPVCGKQILTHKILPKGSSGQYAEVSDLCRRAQENEHFADGLHTVPTKRVMELGGEVQGFQPLIIQMRRRGYAAAFTIDSFLRLELLPQICGSCFKAICDVVQPCGIFVQPA